MYRAIIPTAELASLTEVQPTTFEDGRQLPQMVYYKGWPRTVQIYGAKALLMNPAPSEYAIATGSKQ
jgi:hypothetical protein